MIWGAPIRGFDLVSAGEGATTGEAPGSRLFLEQPIGRAETGESPTMIAKAFFPFPQPGGTIVFEITRGDLGSTQVEFLRQEGEEWVAVQMVTRDGVLGDGRDAHSFSVSAEESLGRQSVTAAGTGVNLEAAPVGAVTGLPPGTDGYPWWNDSVLYEIFIRSFYDSDGEGIGDLNGIRQMDYLNNGDPCTSADLGITGIWLMPIFPPPPTTATTSRTTMPSSPTTGPGRNSRACWPRPTRAASGSSSIWSSTILPARIPGSSRRETLLPHTTTDTSGLRRTPAVSGPFTSCQVV